MRIALAGPVRVADLSAWLDLTAVTAVPSGMGGTPVTLLAAALLGRGHEVTVVTLNPGVAGEVVLGGPRLRVCVNPARPRHRARDAYRAERRLLTAALRRERPDLVHAHWTYEYALAALATGLPTLVTVHDWAPRILRMMPDPYRLVRLGMNARVLAGAGHLTTVSPYVAGRLARWGRRDVAVVGNGLDEGMFGAPRRARQPGPGVLVAVIDGFTRWKNVGALLRAHARLAAARPGLRLILVGGGHGPGGEAQRWARSQGLGEGVEFRGPVPYAQIAPLMGAADVCVHPSLEESFGMVVLEAMAQSLPVVGGARSGGVPWLLDGGRAGVLVDVTSPAAIAEGVSGLLDDPARWGGYAAAGRERAWERFRMARNTDGYLAAYARVLTRPRPSRIAAGARGG